MTNIGPEICARPYCRQHAVLEYLGRPICAQCWTRLCKLDYEGELEGDPNRGKNWWLNHFKHDTNRRPNS